MSLNSSMRLKFRAVNFLNDTRIEVVHFSPFKKGYSFPITDFLRFSCAFIIKFFGFIIREIDQNSTYLEGGGMKNNEHLKEGYENSLMYVYLVVSKNYRDFFIYR